MSIGYAIYGARTNVNGVATFLKNGEVTISSAVLTNSENLGKKFDRTVTYYDDPSIPRTNNGIERYFGITLPSHIKRRYRTIEGLTRWLRLQKIRWVRRNVLHDYTIENTSLTQHIQEKNHAFS